MNEIVIIGVNGFGKEVAWLIEEINKVYKLFDIVGFIDNNSKLLGKCINGYKVVGNMDYLKNKENLYFVCAEKDPTKKKELVEEALSVGAMPQALIHPSVMYSSSTYIGEGTIICYGNIISVNTKIMDYVTLDLNSVIAHDVIIEDYCTIHSGTNIKANSQIGTLSELETGTIVKENTRIVEESKSSINSVL